MNGNNTLIKTIFLSAVFVLVGVGCAPEAEQPQAPAPTPEPASVTAPEEAGDQLDPSESEESVPAEGSTPESGTDIRDSEEEPKPEPVQPSCTEDEWSCGDWSACSAEGMQTRNCEMTFDCPGIVTRGPAESRACEPPAQEPEPVAFTFEGDDDAFYPSGPLDVSAGAQVTLTFIVRAQNVYYGGLEFRAPGRFDTGPLDPGDSATVSFVADQDFVITSYWPSSNAKKADLQVNVTP